MGGSSCPRQTDKKAAADGCVPDAGQRELLDRFTRMRPGVPPVFSVLGVPGAGKTFTLRAAVKELTALQKGIRIAVIAPGRKNAERLRNTLSLDLGGLPAGVEVRSLAGFAFSVVRLMSSFTGRGEPQLLSGPDQDVLVKDAFEAVQSDGVLRNKFRLLFEKAGFRVGWEKLIGMPAFRTEFRELLVRAAELGIDAGELAEYGKNFGEYGWQIGAELMPLYEDCCALETAISAQKKLKLDHARLIREAVRILHGKSGDFLQVREKWDWILFDDFQNSTLISLDLLRELHSLGSAIAVFGNPDTAVNGFRGGISSLPLRICRPEKDGGLNAQKFTLQGSYRLSGDSARIALLVTNGIRTREYGTHRRVLAARAAQDSAPAGQTGVHLRIYPDTISEITDIANEFMRIKHTVPGANWSQMAVITRGQSIHHEIFAVFRNAGIPVRRIRSDLPLSKQPIVAAIAELAELALFSAPDAVQYENLLDGVLRGKFFSLTNRQIRAMKNEIWGWELAAGGERPQSEVICDIIRAHPKSPVWKVPAAAKLAGIAKALREDVKQKRNAYEVLWNIWQNLDLASKWQDLALRDTAQSERINPDLDVLMQLFSAARRACARNGENLPFTDFMDDLAALDIAEDSLAPGREEAGRVTLTTPSGSVGRSWRYVAVSEVNEGVWPNPRPHNPVSHVPRLVSVRLDAAMPQHEESGAFARSHADVVDGELKAFLQAVTRSEKELFVTCVKNEETHPSPFIGMLTRREKAAQNGEDAGGGKNEKKKDFRLLPEYVRTAGRDYEYTALIGRLRRFCMLDEPEIKRAAREVLRDYADFSAAGGPSAQDIWYSELELSTEAENPEYCSISPSGFEAVQRCPLNAFFSRIGGQDADVQIPAAVGTLIHSIAEKYPFGGLAAMREELYSRLPSEVPCSDPLNRNKWLNAALKMLSAYQMYIDGGNYAQRRVTVLPETEASLKNTGEKYTVRARIDRIEIDEDEKTARIIDFKTGKKAISKNDAQNNAQLRIYQWLIRKNANMNLKSELRKKLSHSDLTGAMLLYLQDTSRSGEPGQRLQSPPDEEDMKRTEEELAQASVLMRQGNIRAVPNALCGRCEFANLCPAQNGGRIFS